MSVRWLNDSVRGFPVRKGFIPGFEKVWDFSEGYVGELRVSGWVGSV